MSALIEVWVDDALRGFATTAEEARNAGMTSRFLSVNLKCGECARQGIGFRDKGQMCAHAVSTDNRHLPPPEAPACFAFIPRVTAQRQGCGEE